MMKILLNVGDRDMVFIPFHWVFGGQEGKRKKEKKGKRERLWEIKHIFFTIYWFYCLWLCEVAKMQPTDSISNSEVIVLLGIWYIGFQYIYIIYGAVFVVENAIFCKKNEFSLTQPLPAASCYLYNLLPIFRNSEGTILSCLWSFCVLHSQFLWFIVLYLWWKCDILKKNSVRHSHSYLPFDSVVIRTTHC